MAPRADGVRFDPVVVRHDDRLLRELLRETCETMHEVDERFAVRRRCATEASHEQSGFSLVDELLRVDVGEGCSPDSCAADQLGEDAARPEGDERPEDRILHDSGEELGSPFDLRLHDHRRAYADYGRAHGDNYRDCLE